METTQATTEAEPSTTSAVETTQAAQTAQQGVQTAPQAIVNPDGTFREGWTEDETLSGKFTSVGALAQSYKNLERMLGSEKIPLPRDDSPQDVWENAWNKLGRPDNAADYEIDKPDDLPPGLQWSDEEVNGFKEFAHKLGLTQRQVAELVKFDTNRLSQSYQRGVEAREQNLVGAQKELQDAWGKDFDANLLLAQNAARALDESILDDEALGNNPKVINMLAEVGKMMSEGRLKASRGMVTPTTNVEAELAQIENRDPSNPWSLAYWNGSHPDHAKAVAYVQKLYKAKFPDQ